LTKPLNRVHNCATNQDEGAGMRFVSVRDLRGRSAEIWRQLPEEREMVITNNGRPIAILAAIGESNLEATLASFRRTRAVEAAAALQREGAAHGANLTPAEIEAEIGAARRARRP
jgi:antitoxin (DNA-binding transcriptional repressor) of toxin-antitoxin stability system